jgi:hypothetical protein
MCAEGDTATLSKRSQLEEWCEEELSRTAEVVTTSHGCFALAEPPLSGSSIAHADYLDGRLADHIRYSRSLHLQTRAMRRYGLRDWLLVRRCCEDRDAPK